MINTFNSLEELNFALTQKPVLVFYQNLHGYPGMVLALSIYFKQKENYYGIDLRWQCLGLDLYGDSLEESYEYAFENIEALLTYLEEEYQITLDKIPLNYSFDNALFPSPLKEEQNKEKYETAWKNFQQNFNRGKFLDLKQKLVYSSKES